MASSPGSDNINQLAGISEASPAAALRREKPNLVAFAQASDQALLEPQDAGGVSLRERHAIAFRVGLLTGFDAVATRHRARLTSLGQSDAEIDAIRDFPDETSLSPRLAALLGHTDRVTLEPGASRPEHIEVLAAAGLSPAEIVTVGQLLGFLAYQIRAVAVAQALGEGQ
jgi:uncharacterized protein YciW